MNTPLHPQTKLIIERYQTSPVQAALITGPSLATTEVAQMLTDNLKATILTIETPPKAKNIGIDQVIELQHLAKSRGEGSQLLVAIIKNAHELSLEAQNAFLKLLEEPPAQVRFILTAHSPKQLLPTILSRTDHIPVRLDLSYSELGDQRLSDLQSSHRAAILERWLESDGEAGSVLESLQTSKELLGKSLAEQLVLLKTITTREDATTLLIDLQQLCLLAFRNVIFEERDGAAIWLDRLEVIEKSLQNIQANGNVKINLLQTLLSFTTTRSL